MKNNFNIVLIFIWVVYNLRLYREVSYFNFKDVDGCGYFDIVLVFYRRRILFKNVEKVKF